MSQQPISRVLAQDLYVRCLDPRGVFRDVATTFAYDPDDPYALAAAGDWRAAEAGSCGHVSDRIARLLP